MMEKLVELLNEYEVYKGYNGGGWKMTSMGLVYAKNIRDKGAILILKSKEFGFIERLVENDKINFKTFGNAFGTKYLEYPIGSDNYDQVYDYKDIIKWLAISDTPIEDLIYYLKE